MFDQEMANLDLSHEINMDRLDRSVQTSLSDVFGSIAGGFSMGSNLMNFSNQINQFGKDWGKSSTPFGNAIKPFKWN
jgi:hypothetical protein